MPVRGADDRALPPRHPGGAGLRSRPRRAAERSLSGLGAPPAGYRAARRGDTWWWILPEAEASLESSGVVDRLAGPVRRAARREEGRGGTFRCSLGGRAAVGKRLLHGGLLGGVTGSLFLGPSRLEAVVEAVARLRAGGVATPQVIAVGWRPVAGPWGSLVLVTAAIEGGRNLMEILPGTRTGEARRLELLCAAGLLARRLEECRFAHADLNLANLVAGADRGTGLHVVDLEGGRFLPEGSDAARAGLRRLMRSWAKWIEPRAAGGLRDLAAFLRGYSDDRRVRRRVARDLIAYRDRLGPRRLLWALGGRRQA